MGNTQGAQHDQVADLNEQSYHHEGEGEEQAANAEGNQYEFQYTEKDLEYVGQKEEDEAYGEIKIYRIRREVEQDSENAQEDLEVCTKTKIFDSKEDCKDYHKDLQSKKHLNHPHLVKLVKSQAVMNSNFCTNIYKIDMAYEYIKHNLKIEILNRFETKEYFEEDTIFILIEQVMSALYYLNSNGILHGDIQPRTILIDNYGNFRLTDIRFLTSGMCGYKKHLFGLETECFLAPELLQKLRRQTILENEEVDQERADIFSLGLVALAMGTLQSVDSIYDFENYTLKEEEILNLLEIIKEQYSYNLYLLLVSMLNQIDKRINLVNGLELVDQMRSGHFNLEEYEMKRFQSELEQSERKLVDSVTHPLQNPQSPDNNNNNNQIDNIIPVNQFSRQSSQQAYQQGEFTNTSASNDGRILDFDPDREARKRSRKDQREQSQNQQQQPTNNGNFNNSNVNANPVNRNGQFGLNESTRNNDYNQNQNQNQFETQPLQKTNTLNSDQKRNPKQVNQLVGQQNSQTHLQGHNLSDQKSDRYDNNHHQFNNGTQNSNQKLGHSSQQYQNINPMHQSGQNQSSIHDIENRFREAIQRSQQVSLKFENSPLRLFRDQLLADELYVPLDPQFTSSSHLKSRHLEGSGRKNQLSQSNKLNYSNNVSQNFSAQKNAKKNDSTQRLVQKKWKI